MWTKLGVLIQWFLQGVDIKKKMLDTTLSVLIQWFLQGVDIHLDDCEQPSFGSNTMVFTRGRYPWIWWDKSKKGSNTMVFTRGRYLFLLLSILFFVLIQWFLQGVDITSSFNFFYTWF